MNTETLSKCKIVQIVTPLQAKMSHIVDDTVVMYDVLYFSSYYFTTKYCNVPRPMVTHLYSRDLDHLHKPASMGAKHCSRAWHLKEIPGSAEGPGGITQTCTSSTWRVWCM